MLLVLVQTSLATSFLPREQAVLSDANTASRSCGLKTKLESHWDDTCALIVHAEQPEIKFDKASSKKLFRPSKCYLNGLCICGKGPPENTYSTRVVDRITNIMKQVFWSKGSGKDRKTSKPRELLESLEVVLALRPTGGHDAEDKGLWLLLGFVNYKTWKVTVLDLMCAAVAPDGSRAWLQLVDVQASDMEYFLEELDAEDDNEHLHQLGLQVRTLLEAVKTKLSFQQSYVASFWKMAPDVSPGTTLLEEMLPCFLQVIPLEDAPEHSVWDGPAAKDEQHRFGTVHSRLSPLFFSIHYSRYSPIATVKVCLHMTSCHEANIGSDPGCARLLLSQGPIVSIVPACLSQYDNNFVAKGSVSTSSA